MWSEMSVFWQLSHKSTFGSSSQLRIVTDDHKWLHQSISMQAVRPTRTDMTYPLLFPLQPEEEKNDFWAQAERWWATFLTSFHTHHKWESESMQVLVCIRCKYTQDQAGLGSGVLRKEKLWPSALQWKIFNLQRQGKAWAPETSHSITLWRRLRCSEHCLTALQEEHARCIWAHWERRLPDDSWELPKGLNKASKSVPGDWNQPLHIDTSPSPCLNASLNRKPLYHPWCWCQCKKIPECYCHCSPVPATFLIFLHFVPCSPGSHSSSECSAAWKHLSHSSNYHQSEKNLCVLVHVPSLEHHSH